MAASTRKWRAERERMDSASKESKPAYTAPDCLHRKSPLTPRLPLSPPSDCFSSISPSSDSPRSRHCSPPPNSPPSDLPLRRSRASPYRPLHRPIDPTLPTAPPLPPPSAAHSWEAGGLHSHNRTVNCCLCKCWAEKPRLGFEVVAAIGKDRGMRRRRLITGRTMMS